MKKTLRRITLAGLVILVATSMASANLIENGSFEDDTQTITSFMTLTNGSTAIPSWTVVGGSIDWIGGYWQASDGSKSLDLAGNSNGTVMSIGFATEVGKTYLVEFDMAGNPDKSYDKALIGAAVGGDTFNFTFSQAGNTKTDMGWVTQSFTFLANSVSTQLTFGNYSSTQTSWGAALDNIRVDVAPVPEPGTLLLLGSGLAGLAVYRRRMNKL